MSDNFFSNKYMKHFLPLLIFFAIMAYDFWISFQHETLETGVLNAISTVVNTFPWVFTLYWLCKWDRQGVAWLVLIPKFFVGIFGGYIALRFLGRFREESEENREVTDLKVNGVTVESFEEKQKESKEDEQDKPRLERSRVHTPDAGVTKKVPPRDPKEVRDPGSK